MTLGANGRLGIGTASPATALHVYNSSQGLARFESTQGEVNIALNNSTASGNLIGTIGANFYFYSAGSEHIRITSGGNLLIGTAANGASKLRIVGLPTSAVGLSSGDVYSNAGILTIVP